MLCSYDRFISFLGILPLKNISFDNLSTEWFTYNINFIALNRYLTIFHKFVRLYLVSLFKYSVGVVGYDFDYDLGP